MATVQDLLTDLRAQRAALIVQRQVLTDAIARLERFSPGTTLDVSITSAKLIDGSMKSFEIRGGQVVPL